MSSKVICLLITCALAIALVTTQLWSAPLSAESVPPEIAEAARTYANAMAAGDHKTAWDLLSSESRAQITAPEWESAFTRAPSVRKPPQSTLLKAMATAPTPPEVIEVLPRAHEALVHVGGSIQITQQIVFVREATGWRVDLGVKEVIPPPDAVSDEVRTVEFELVAPGDQSGGIVKIPVEAFYNVCLDDGVCLFRRKDTQVEIHITGRY